MITMMENTTDNWLLKVEGLTKRFGSFAAVDPALERVLGRPPTTMRDFLAERLRPSGSPR